MKKRLTATMLAAVLFLGGCAFAEDEYVRLTDGVTPDMLNADFWIAKMPDADATLMTTDEILAYSEKHAELIGDADGAMHSLASIGETLDGGMLRRLIESLLATRPEDPATVYLNGQPTTAAYWDELCALGAVDKIPDIVPVRFGYSVKRASLRMFPSDDFIGETPEDTFYDENVCSELLPFLPLCIVHESADGEWLYVILYGMSGWIRKDCVAACESRADWLARQEQKELLIVTGRELRLSVEPLVPELSGLLLPMGTRLPLLSAKDAPRLVNGRQTYGSYVVKLPTRGEDGRLVDRYMLIPVCDDVNVGFLPYTRANVLRLAFKLLGDRYGWAGMFHANDCSGIVHEIFACFGFILPRTAGKQAQAQGLKQLDVSAMTDEEKLAALDGVPAGSLLNFPGHIMLYLGKQDGLPYTVSSAGSLAAWPEGEVEHVSSVVLNHLNVRRRNGATWLASLTLVNLAAPE